jgi:pyruvate,water dikinase
MDRKKAPGSRAPDEFTNLVLPLGELGEQDRGRFGSKSVNLSLLAGLGLPVPDGFAVAFEAGRSGALTPEEKRLLIEAYADLGRRIACDLPRVAVRSSAVGEDGAEHSFAGQYHTSLDLRGELELVRAVEECLASQASERVARYRAASGAETGGMGVLVQRMVRAEYAGVCFTRSPVSTDQVAVEAVEGLGESLVSGERRPARACFTRKGLELSSADDPGGLFALMGAEAAREVARLSLAAEEGLGFAVDLEWALAKEEIWLVQARPITGIEAAIRVEEIRRGEIERLRRAAREAGRLLVWSDFSLADMIPHPTPLAFEMLSLLMRRRGSHERAMRALGLRAPGPDELGENFELICGRSYLNLEVMVQCIDGALPLELDSKKLPKAEGRTVDLESIPVRLGWRGWRSARRLPGALPRWLFAAPVRFFRLRRRFDREFRRRVEPAVIAEAAHLRERDLTALGNAELWTAFSSHVQRFVDVMFYHQVADAVAFATHTLLRRSLRRLYGDGMESAEMRLTTALAGNFNTETNLDLARVAAGELGMEEFLERYGHRGSPDYEIASPRWREDPERVEAMAAAIARAGSDPARRFREQQEIRFRAEARLSADLRRDWWLRPWRGAILKELEYYQRYSPLRESTQALGFLFIELARRTLLEAARRSRAGELIFFFRLAELEKLFLEGVGPEELERAHQRRERLRAARRIPLPHLLRSDDLEAIGRVPEVSADEQVLMGQGVSAGAVRGPARVVSGLDQARELHAGEILVATSADPSWTPLFLVAGGVVLEQGGMLSHPAIVAREYGLPAVVNVPHATRRIRTGQQLMVDGERGRVILED